MLRKNTTHSLNKKASERVPRQNPLNSSQNKDLSLKKEESQSHNREMVQAGMMPKPGDGDPKSNIKQTQIRKNLAEKRRKDQQEKEKAKLDEIEAKIENARKRFEEKKKVKSQNAKNVMRKKTTPNI